MKKTEKSPAAYRTSRGEKNTGQNEQTKTPSSSVGYYDFTQDYPGEQRADGVYFRSDAPGRFSRRQKLLIAAAAILVFCAAFTICRVMMHISEKQPGAIGDAPAWETESTAAPPEIVTAPPGDG